MYFGNNFKGYVLKHTFVYMHPKYKQAFVYKTSISSII